MLPAPLTLDGVASMNEADTHGYRYELSPGGVLSVMPPPDPEHGRALNGIMGWLITTGWPLEQITQAVGLRVPGRDGGAGGRVPDVVVWSRPPARDGAAWLPGADVAAVVEIMSPGSRSIDRWVKADEYAGAGIPRYWTIDHDPAQTVSMYELAGAAYTLRVRMALDLVRNTEPADHLS